MRKRKAMSERRPGPLAARLTTSSTEVADDASEENRNQDIDESLEQHQSYADEGQELEREPAWRDGSAPTSSSRATATHDFDGQR